MWLNSTTNEEPHQGLTFRRNPAETWDLLRDGGTGAAWLSSACALRCTLKWGNMRNPHPAFHVSQETARDNWEEGEDDAKSAWPFDALGRTHDTMGLTMGEAVRRR